MTGDNCVVCGARLGPDDDGLTRRTLDREAEEFYCTPCLARKLGTTVEQLERMAETLRRGGCTLFRPWTAEDEKRFREKYGTGK